jgi:hypothetical protein
MFSRMVPLLVEAAFTVGLAEAPPVVLEEVAAPVLPVLPAVVVVALVGLEEPHAASTRPTTARAATAVPGRTRLKKRCDADRPGCPDGASSSRWLVIAKLP